jgi:deoxyribodipyrimidine photo-lyase
MSVRVSGRCTIWWIRRDLRLDDNAALLRAALSDTMVPVFVDDEGGEGAWGLGGAQRWWVARSIASLAHDLAQRGSRLIVLRGRAAAELVSIARACNASEVCWSRRFEPAAKRQESEVEGALDQAGIGWSSFLSNHLFDPDEIQTQTGNPYQVYTPFSRNLRARGVPGTPREAPAVLPPVGPAPAGLGADAMAYEPVPDWAGGMRERWTVGEAGARAALERFIGSGALSDYPDGRDIPSVDGTSLLSPYLAFGEIGIRRIWREASQARGASAAGIDKFHAELLWREFATHVLHHFPRTEDKPLRAEFAAFPWADDRPSLRAWQRGRTGYPLVDAGMRQLWATGWMHNRVRMVVASFLVKHLLLPWQDGARWFWDTLVDADLANNSLGWQWAAGCGADAAPYFRIFNPTSQAEKFDAGGAYIRKWVPELARVPDKFIFAPWEAPATVLAAAGVRLGREYPEPIVEHGFARKRALDALAKVSRGS